MQYYTGVGSRDTPDYILQVMYRIAKHLANSDTGWVLRSGGADGADDAFFGGCGIGEKEIYLPWDGFNGFRTDNKEIFLPEHFKNYDTAKRICSTVHGYYGNLKRGALALHHRNIYQVLGLNLHTDSKAVFCWAPPTKNGRVKGGTATAVELALRKKIPVYNLYFDNVLEAVIKKYC